MNFEVTVSSNIKGLRSLEKQVTYAAKRTCTEVAFLAQKRVIKQLHDDFTIRDTWYEENRRHGIHVRYTKDKADLSAQVKTDADWLVDHETGNSQRQAEHHAGGEGGAHLALPDPVNTRKQDIYKIPKAEKARRIMDNKSRRAFKVHGKNQDFIFERIGEKVAKSKRAKRGEGKKRGLFDNKQEVRIKYRLRESVKIEKISVVTAPVRLTVDEQFSNLFHKTLQKALETAR